MGVEPERGGVPSEVDPARGPACHVTETQGTGRQEPLKTIGTRPRALRGGKGGGRVFGRRPQDRGVRLRGGKAETGQEGFNVHTRRRGRSRGCQTLGIRQGRGQRGGRGVTGHSDRANSADRGDRSRGGGRKGGSTTNCRSSSTPTSRRGWLERRIQLGADLLAESLPLELGQGRDRQVEDLKHIGKENTLQSLHRAELRGQECCSTLDKVGVEGGSELDPIDVASRAALGGDDV